MQLGHTQVRVSQVDWKFVVEVTRAARAVETVDPEARALAVMDTLGDYFESVAPGIVVGGSLSGAVVEPGLEDYGVTHAVHPTPFAAEVAEAYFAAMTKDSPCFRSDPFNEYIGGWFGQPRVARFRAFEDEVEPPSGPTRESMGAFGLIDRMTCGAASPQGELFFVLNRREGSPPFSESDAATALAIVQGMSCLARQAGMLFGGGDESRRLSPRERETVLTLLRGVPDEVSAEQMGLTQASYRQYCTRCYRKLKVRGRSELSARWFGVSPGCPSA